MMKIRFRNFTYVLRIQLTVLKCFFLLKEKKTFLVRIENNSNRFKFIHQYGIIYKNGLENKELCSPILQKLQLHFLRKICKFEK